MEQPEPEIEVQVEPIPSLLPSSADPFDEEDLESVSGRATTTPGQESSIPSTRTASSLFHVEAKDSNGVMLLVSRKVTITYGPYITLGNMDYQIERLRGIIQVLRNAGADVIVKPSYHYNEVRVWHLENMIYSCKITDLQHGVDGSLDHRANEAGKALRKSTRKAHFNLKERYKTAEKIMAKCPCHPDYVGLDGEKPSLIRRIKIADHIRRESTLSAEASDFGLGEISLYKTSFPHFFHPELYREAPSRRVDKEKSRVNGIYNKVEAKEVEQLAKEAELENEQQEKELMKPTTENSGETEHANAEIEYIAYKPKKITKAKSRHFSISQEGSSRNKILIEEAQKKFVDRTTEALKDNAGDPDVDVDEFVEKIESLFTYKN